MHAFQRSLTRFHLQGCLELSRQRVPNYSSGGSFEYLSETLNLLAICNRSRQGTRRAMAVLRRITVDGLTAPGGEARRAVSVGIPE